MNPLYQAQPMSCFTPMPYTRLDLMTATSMVLGGYTVATYCKLGVAYDIIVQQARYNIVEFGRNPYKPTSRVIRQASIDLEVFGKFIYAEDTG